MPLSPRACQIVHALRASPRRPHCRERSPRSASGQFLSRWNRYGAPVAWAPASAPTRRVAKTAHCVVAPGILWKLMPRESASSTPDMSSARMGSDMRAPPPHAASTCTQGLGPRARRHAATAAPTGSKAPRTVVPAVRPRRNGRSPRALHASRTRRRSGTSMAPRASTATRRTLSSPTPMPMAALTHEKCASSLTTMTPPAHADMPLLRTSASSHTRERARLTAYQLAMLAPATATPSPAGQPQRRTSLSMTAFSTAVSTGATSHV
mmetsp:Transcript_3031/g.7922  ORF Transcript_3031/g.7922 Transcript_3031/m.7922 type:complete len:266 (+) Transcript_3031:1099-1896(+)